MLEDQHPHKVCPYWAPDQEPLCTMTVSGLYMPLREHVMKFCRTAQAEECPQYRRGCETLEELARKRALFQEQGRRRHQRFGSRHALTFAAAEQPDTPPARLQQSAQTLDFSLGGMRLETEVELPESATIAFAFGDDFRVPGLSGLAEVRWCRRAEDADRFQAGLCFLDEQIGSRLGESLAL